MAIRKSELYSSIWASCDELRGGMDASQYKDYVLFMLFMKYVSDKYGNSDDFAPPIIIPEGASFQDMAALKGNPGIGDKINTEVIQPLVDANAMLGRTDFPDFNDPNKLGEGDEKVKRLENLIAIFQNPALDFSGNRAENDDILGDAYEYLMRHFATQSGKSKGQFYTPSEVSRVIAKVIGISPENAIGATTAYDPTCGSGSLLLKVAFEAGKRITLEGQEKDVTTAGLARMNMILHDFPTAKIMSGNTLTSPKFFDGERLRTYDYVVANPPFSDKAWSTGLVPENDHYDRFTWGSPPAKQGDYAYLLHIIRSMKATGKGACILPHGVLFRGNAEATVREQLIRSGYLKGIIGLPPNLFYGTGIPACILVLDKENATARRGVFMIDASKDFIKDGAKNRLREQDIHKIVDTFIRTLEIPRYSRMTPFEEIADPKNAFNLNLPRYIDSSDSEDLHDIEGHLRGGIPERDIEALTPFWQVMPGIRAALFEPAGRPGYHQLRLQQAEVKPAILNHGEFRAFTDGATGTFQQWRTHTTPKLTAFGPGASPKELIDDISEDLLIAFRATALVDPYDIYQRLMDYWAEAMQDDCYLISDEDWVAGAQPREIKQVRVKDKPSWPEAHDYLIGRRRFKSDLIPATLMIAAFFAPEQAALNTLDAQIAELEQQLADELEDGAGEDGLLAEVIEGDGNNAKITAKAIKARLKEIGRDAETAEERAALKDYLALIDGLAGTRSRRKAAEMRLNQLVHDKYAVLTEDQVKDLTINAKWLATLDEDVQGEVARVSQTLTGRVRVLAERYATPLPALEAEVAALQTRVADHLRTMGACIMGVKPGHKQTEVGVIPEDWEVKRLGELLQIRHGRSQREVEVEDGPYPILATGGQIGTASQSLYDRPSVLIGRKGTIDEPRFMDTPFWSVDTLFYSEMLRGSDAKFLFYRFNMIDWRRHNEASGVPSLNAKTIENIEIECPEPPEQTAIAAVLSDIDAEIEALGMQLDKTRAIKQAMMQALLTGRVRLPAAKDAEKEFAHA